MSSLTTKQAEIIVTGRIRKEIEEYNLDVPRSLVLMVVVFLAHGKSSFFKKSFLTDKLDRNFLRDQCFMDKDHATKIPYLIFDEGLDTVNIDTVTLIPNHKRSKHLLVLIKAINNTVYALDIVTDETSGVIARYIQRMKLIVFSTDSDSNPQVIPADPSTACKVHYGNYSYFTNIISNINGYRGIPLFSYGCKTAGVIVGKAFRELFGNTNILHMIDLTKGFQRLQVFEMFDAKLSMDDGTLNVLELSHT